MSVRGRVKRAAQLNRAGGLFGSYVCAECGQRFNKTFDDAEAFANDKQVFGDELTHENAAIVCEDCYQSIIACRAGGW